MSLFNLYLITILPNIGDFFIALSIGTIAVFLMLMVITSMTIDCTMDSNTEKAAKEARKKIILSYKLFVSIVIIFGILAVLIPSEKQIYQIVGGYSVTNIEGIDKLPANLVAVANKYLEELKVK